MVRKSRRLQQEQARRLAAASLEVQATAEGDGTPQVPIAPQVMKTLTSTSVGQPPIPPLVPTAPQVPNTTTDTSICQPQAPPLIPTGVNNVAHPAAPHVAPPAVPPAEPMVLRIRCRNPKDGVEASKRRVIYSNKTTKIASATIGGRIKLEYLDFHIGPKSAGNCSLLVRDIGVAIRTHVPMTASTFYELSKDEKAAVGAYLMNYYEIPKTDLAMWNFIDKKSYEWYKAWKHKCHKHFKKHRPAVPFEFLNRPHEWDYLVENEFLNETKKAISVRNTNNRTKNPNPINHCAGARALSYMAKEHLLAGHPAPYCAAAVDAYITSKNGREKALSLKRKLDDIIEERASAEDSENLQPLSNEEQSNLMIIDIGDKKGTGVRGAGPTLKRAAKPRGRPSIDIVQLQEKNQKTEERAAEAEEKTRVLEDRVKAMEAILQKFVDA